MFKAVKCFEFEMAHRLECTETDKCKNIHGHTYKLEVEISRENLDVDSAMVEDFSVISEKVKETVIKVFDHSFVIKMPEYLNTDGRLFVCDPKNTHNVYLVQQPTAEYMCLLFYRILIGEFSGISRIRLWETSNSYAEFIPGE